MRLASITNTFQTHVERCYPSYYIDTVLTDNSTNLCLFVFSHIERDQSVLYIQLPLIALLNLFYESYNSSNIQITFFTALHCLGKWFHRLIPYILLKVATNLFSKTHPIYCKSQILLNLFLTLWQQFARSSSNRLILYP